MSVEDRFAAILAGRFVAPARAAESLGGSLPAEVGQACSQALFRVWDSILASAELRPHIEQDHLPALQRTFRDYALLCRLPLLYGPGAEAEPVPCTLETLRGRCAELFLDLPERNLWYGDLAFYRALAAPPHWVLVDRDYLNCTFRKPSIRLLMYARANQLPIPAVRQKSVLEDVYDRIVLQRVLGQSFFKPCNSVTSTVYQQDRRAPMRQVYVYAREERIRISGRMGLPHWRPTRPRWPGVLPSVVFPVDTVP